MAAVPQHHAAHVAHAGAVHEHLARSDGAPQLAGLGGELDHPADVADDDVVGGHPHLLGQLGVDLQMALFPVDGDEELGLHQAVDDLQLLLAGVAGHMEGQRPLVDHLGSLPVELVDHVAHGVLVAGNGGGGDDDLVPRLDVHLPVGGEGHPGERRHGLTLAAGGNDAHLVLGQGLDLGQVHEHPVGDLHIAQLGGYLHGVLHGPAGDRYLAAVPGCHIDDLLQAVHVGGEGGDDDALLAALEQGVKRVAHAALATGVAWALHVGGVGQQSQHPLLPQCAESGQVDHAPLDGGGVDLEVAGVDDGAHRALDGEGHRVGDGVVHVDELNGELARLDHVPRLAGDHLGLGHQVVLLQLQLDQARAHAGGVNGGVDGPQHIGDGSDVVLVAVGDEDAPDLALVFDQIAHIRNDHVDAVHIVIREPHSAVHDHDVVPVLIDGQVFPDLIQASQRYDFQFFCHISFLSQSIFSIMIHLYQKTRDKTPCGRTTTRRKGPCPQPCLAVGR